MNTEMRTRVMIFGFGLFLVICLVTTAFIGGIFFLQGRGDGETREVTSQTIVEKISDEAFLVTKSVFADEQVTIDIDQGSEWSNFWWGQEITAEGLVRIDVGVDYKKIEEGDIEVDHGDKKITIDMPTAEVLDASVMGDIEVEATSGLLRRLLDNDPTRDHNLASAELIRSAQDSLTINEAIYEEAQADSAAFLQVLLRETGYEVVIK